MKFLYPTGGRTDGYGIITAPNHGGVVAGIKANLPWAADVGCIDGPKFVKRANFDDVFSWLNTMKPYKNNCLFIAGFDIVGDAVGTLETFEEFGRYFIHDGWPFAYVSQNGAEKLSIPPTASALFVGGVPTGEYIRQSNGVRELDWKDSMQSVDVIKRAQAMGLHIHIGRVNWRRRYNLFRVLDGSDNFTCDGTRTRYGATKAYQDWKSYERQPPLITI